MVYSSFLNLLLFLNVILALLIHILFLRKKGIKALKLSLILAVFMTPSLVASIWERKDVYLCRSLYTLASEIKCEDSACTAKVNNQTLMWEQPFKSKAPEICLSGQLYEQYIGKDGLQFKKSKNLIFLKTE